MVLASLFRRKPHREAVRRAYAAIVERARAPVFFLEWGVPDTLDGRFEVIALHGFLVLHRLRAEHSMTADYAQDLFDVMFVDLDRGLREMGASDLGVGRHVKAMAQAFYGRIVAYEEGLASGDEVLVEALRRNLYGTTKPRPDQLARLAAYLRSQETALAAVPATGLLAGEVSFAPVGREL